MNPKQTKIVLIILGIAMAITLGILLYLTLGVPPQLGNMPAPVGF